MTQTNISYKQILNMANEYLVYEDKELYLNPQDVSATAKLSHLHFNDVVTIQLIKYIEDKLNIPQIDDTKIDYKKFKNLGEFCRAICFVVNVHTNEKISDAILKHLQDTLGIYYAKPESNFYADLQFDSFARIKFCAWIKDEFGVDIVPMKFTTVNTVIQIVFQTLSSQYKKDTNKKTDFIDRLYNHLHQYKFWHQTNRVK